MHDQAFQVPFSRLFLPSPLLCWAEFPISGSNGLEKVSPQDDSRSSDRVRHPFDAHLPMHLHLLLLEAKPSTESVAKRRQERNLTWSSAVGRMQAEHECPGEASRTAGDIPVPRAHGCFTRTVGACTTRLGFGSW